MSAFLQETASDQGLGDPGIIGWFMRWKDKKPRRDMFMFFANKSQVDILFTNNVSADRLALERFGVEGVDLESTVGSHPLGEEIGIGPLINLDLKIAPALSTSVVDGHPSNVLLCPCFAFLCLLSFGFDSLIGTSWC